MKKQFLLIFILSLLPLAMLSGKGIWDNTEEKDLMEITGRIKIKGNEPHTSVILVTGDGIDYILLGEKSLEIMNNYQLQIVMIKARILKSAEALKPAALEVISYRVLDSSD